FSRPLHGRHRHLSCGGTGRGSFRERSVRIARDAAENRKSRDYGRSSGSFHRPRLERQRPLRAPALRKRRYRLECNLCVQVAKRGDCGKQRPCLFFIPPDLRNQRIETIKFQLVAKIAEERNRADLPVEVTGKIEEKCLKKRSEERRVGKE